MFCMWKPEVPPSRGGEATSKIGLVDFCSGIIRPKWESWGAGNKVEELFSKWSLDLTLGKCEFGSLDFVLLSLSFPDE